MFVFPSIKFALQRAEGKGGEKYREGLEDSAHLLISSEILKLS